MDLNQFSTVDIVLDKANDNIIQRQTISAGDRDGRSLTLQVTNEGSIGEVPGLTANLLWTNHSSGVSDLSAFSVVDRTKSVFKINYPQNMLTAGKVTAQIQLLHNGKVTHSKKFEIIVLDIAGKLKGVLQSAEYTALVEALAKANEFETDIAEVTAQLAQKANQEALEVEKSRIDNFIALPDGSTTNDARLEDIAVGESGEVYESPGEAVRSQFNKVKNDVSDISITTSFPFDESVEVSSIKHFVTDIYSDDFLDYEYCTLRFGDNITESFGLILYGWKNNVKTIISRATVLKNMSTNSITELPLIHKTHTVGTITLDGGYLYSVLGVISTLVANTDGYKLSKNITYKVTRDVKTLEIESKANETYADLKSRNDYFIDSATLGISFKNRANNGIKELKIYCKKEVSEFGINRLYLWPARRQIEFNYLKADGSTLGTISYAIDGVQTDITTENITIENDDVHLFISINWSETLIVRESGLYDYQETGIKDDYIIGVSEYTFLKKLYEQSVQGGDGGNVTVEITGETIGADLIVCGPDATPNQIALAMAMSDLGYGYVCDELELDDGVNAFIDSFMSSDVTIRFYGTIRTSKGIHKHPKHNLIGYDCTLKSGDNLGMDYWACIFPTSGGIDFDTKQVISHNHTFVKGFTLDGNCQNNMVDGNYSYKGIYGGAISSEIYNEDVSPYSKTQLVANLVIEDIKAVNTMRGIIMGIGWIGRNLNIGDAVTDHALYLAGADHAIVENVYITGTHKKGAVSVSSQSWDVNRRVRNVILKNITLDEPIATDGPYLDVRGHFSDMGNNQSLDDVLIDGFYLKKRNATSAIVGATLGTPARAEVNSEYGLRDYATNIRIKNFVADIDLKQTLFLINNANVIMEKPSIRLQNYRPDRPLFKIQSRDILKKALDFNGMRIEFEGVEETLPYTLFGIDNSYATHNQINGLNFNDMVVEGISNYYLFGRADIGDTNTATVKNLSAERVLANPLGTIKPEDAAYISIVENDYHTI